MIGTTLRICLAVVICIISSPGIATAGPAVPGIRNIQQPDSTTFKGTLHGDEYYSWVETLDGLTGIINRETGMWEYALTGSEDGRQKLLPSGIVITAERLNRDAVPSVRPIDPSVIGGIWSEAVRRAGADTRQPRRTKSLSQIRQDQMGSNIGARQTRETLRFTSVPVLAILLEFNNQTIQSAAATWSDKIFGTSEGQMNHYWNEVSYGQFQLARAAETHNAINDGMIKIKLDIDHPQPEEDDYENLKSAITATDPFVNYGSYDTDGDGFLSTSELQLMFIYAGGEGSAGDTGNALWAHQSCIGGDTTPPNLDGVEIAGCTKGSYTRQGERHDDDDHDAPIGTLAHELGHGIFDLPDLYDTDYSSDGIGHWGIMGGGSWGQKEDDLYRGETPVHHCVWSKQRMGFVDVVIVSDETGRVFPKTTDSNFAAAKILTDNPGEYFLIENRQDDGYDRGFQKLLAPPGAAFTGGMAIWHIDDNLAYTGHNETDGHRWVDLEEANDASLDTLEDDIGHANHLFFDGNSTAFDDASTPNSKKYGDTATSISITNISASQDAMTADIAGGDTICLSTGDGTYSTVFADCTRISIEDGHTITWDDGGTNTDRISIESGGILSITGGGTIAGNLIMSGGTLEISAQDVTFTGTPTLLAGTTFNIAGGRALNFNTELTIPDGMTLTLSGSGTLNMDAANSRFLTLSADGVLQLTGNGGTVNDIRIGENQRVSKTGRIDVDSDFNIGKIWSYSNTFADKTIDIAAGKTLAVSGNLTALNGETITLTGSGDLNLPTGALFLYESGTLKLTGSSGSVSYVIFYEDPTTGKIDVDNNFAIGTLSQNNANSGNIDIAADITLTVTNNIPIPGNKLLELSGSGTLNMAAGANIWLGTDKTLKLTGASGTVNSIILVGGETGNIDVDNDFSIDTLNHNVSGNYAVDIATGKTLSLTGTHGIPVNTTLTLTGTGRLAPSALSIDGTLIAGTGILNLKAIPTVTGTLNISGSTLELGADLNYTPDIYTRNASTSLGVNTDATFTSDTAISFANLYLNDHALTLGSDTTDLTITDGITLDNANEKIITQTADLTLTGALTVSGGQITSTGGTLTFSGGGTLSGGTIETTGGTVLMSHTSPTAFQTGSTLALTDSELISTSSGTQASLAVTGSPGLSLTGGNVEDISVSGGVLPTNGTTVGTNTTNVTEFGDINGDMNVDLTDAILCLQIASGIESAETTHGTADINGDNVLGISEVIYVLQKVTEAR